MAALMLTCGGAALTLGGCGGGEGDSVPQTRAVTGRAQITVRWPDRGRLIPFASESIRVRIVRGSSVLGDQLLVRPSGGGTANAVFDRLPTGDVTVQAEAYPSADGSGTAQAQGAVPVTVVGGQTASVRLTLGSTISRVELTPGDQTLTVGQKMTLTLVARNEADEVVLTSPSRVQWGASSTAVFVLGGEVTARAVGQAAILATETESGKTASATVRVSALPTDALLAAYDGFDYTPGMELAGQNGGTGWSGAWQANGSGTPSIAVSGSLMFGNLTTTGNSFRTTSFNAVGHDRRYGPLPTTPGTVRFWSVLMRPGSVTGGTPDSYFGYAVGNRFFGKGGKQEPLGIELGGGGEFISTEIKPQPDTTYFFVIRVRYGAANDTYDFFVNPAPGLPLPTEPNASVIQSHTSASDSGHGFGASIPTVFDELRVGPTWESVSPTTPPG